MASFHSFSVDKSVYMFFSIILFVGLFFNVISELNIFLSNFCSPEIYCVSKYPLPLTRPLLMPSKNWKLYGFFTTIFLE